MALYQTHSSTRFFDHLKIDEIAFNIMIQIKNISMRLNRPLSATKSDWSTNTTWYL